MHKYRPPFTVDEDDEYEYTPVEYGDNEDDDEFEPIPQPRSKRNSRSISNNSPLSANPAAVPTSTSFRSSSKARAMKSNLGPNMTIPEANNNKRRRVGDDLENYLIMRLHCEEKYAWGIIAEMMNEERAKRGGEQNWTAAAVYSRFTRNSSKFAQLQGQAFDHKNYTHIKNEKKTRNKGQPTPRLGESLQVNLIQAVAEEHESFWGGMLLTTCA